MGRKAKTEETEKKDPLLEDGEDTGSDQSESKDASEEEKEEAEAKPEKKPKKAEEKAEAPAKPLNQADHKAVAEATRAKLMAEPQVHFIIPLAAGEKEGAAEMVQINGFRQNIKKGVMVEIPMSVAKVLANHYKIEMTAGSEKRLDRGADVAEALS